MKRKCDLCGEEFIEYDLKRIPTGKRTQWICYKCLDQGHDQLNRRKYAILVKSKKLGQK